MSERSVDDAQSTELATYGGITLGGKLVSRLLGFMFLLTVTRLVSPQAYGIYTLAVSTLLVIQRFSDLNLDGAVDYFIPQALRNEDIATAKSTLANVIGLAVLTSIVVAMIANLFADQLGTALGEPAVAPVLSTLVLLLPLITADRVLTAAFGSVLAFTYRTYTQDLLKPGTKLAATVGLVVLFGNDLRALVGGYATAIVVSVGFSAYFLFRKAPWIWRAPLVSISHRSLLSYSLPLLLAGVGYIFVSQIDYFLIGYFLESADVGVYRIAFYLITNLMVINTTVNTILKPMVARDLNDTASVRHLYRVTTRWVSILLIPPALTLLISPETYLTLLFTPTYDGGATALSVLSLGVLVAAFFGPGSTTIEALGHSRLRLINSVLLLGINAGLDILLIPRFGILGAGVGTAVSLSAIAAVEFGQAFILRRVWPYTGSVLKVWVVAVLTGTAGYLFAQSSVDGVLLAAGLPVVIVVVYLALLRQIRAFTPEDRNLVRRLNERVNIEIFTRLLP